MQRRTLIRTALASLAAGLPALPAFAQGQWPTGKSITYLVPFPAGGTTDVLARLIGQKLGPALNTNVIVDNKGGAGGSVGSEMCIRDRPSTGPSFCPIRRASTSVVPPAGKGTR